MFLIPGAKFAQKVDVNTALYNTIATSRGEPAAAATVTACRTFQTLRAALHEPPTTAATRTAIKRYLSALDHVQRTVAVPELPVQLLWVNAFDGDAHCALPHLALDKVAALFNLGVCEATLAVVAYRTRRTDPSAMQTAARAFQVAAGYFRAAASLPTPGGMRAVTTDLYPPTLRALEMVMLGNAQQTLYEITLANEAPSAFLARFAVGARDFYTVASESCREPDVVNTCINGLVGRPAAALAAYFDCVAQSAQANACADAHDMPQQLARLAKAKLSVTAGLAVVSALDAASLASVASLRADLVRELDVLRRSIRERSDAAEEENRKIYFASPASSVPDIPSRQSVRPADVLDALAAEPLDGSLRSLDDLPEPGTQGPELSGVAARYAELVAHAIADDVASLTTVAAHLHEIVVQTETAMGAARAAISAAPAPVPVPSSSVHDERTAIEAVRFAQQRGGLRAMRELQGEVMSMADETKVQVQAVETLLQTEEAEDRQLRAQMYVTRPSSHDLTVVYRSKMSTVRSNTEQAANADLIVAGQIDYHADAIALVDSVNVEGFEPPSANTSSAGPVQAKQRVGAFITEITPKMASAEQHLTEKDVVVQEFEKKKHLENPYAATSGIIDEATELEQCTDAMNKEYGALKERAEKCREDMKRVDQLLSDASVRLRLPPPSDDNGGEARAKMTELYKLQAPALKFKELMGHLEQGTNFYSREQDVIAMLKKDIEGYVAARKTEADEISQSQTQPPSGGGAGYPNAGYPGSMPTYPSGGAGYPSGGPGYPSGGPGHHPNTYSSNSPHQGPPGAWRRQ